MRTGEINAVIFEELDRQYREQNKPAVWFLPLSEPISTHLNELLGPVHVEKAPDNLGLV